MLCGEDSTDADLARPPQTLTFVEEHHDLLKAPHEVDVVVAVLLDLQQEVELRQTLGGEGFQQKAVLLQRKMEKPVTF